MNANVKEIDVLLSTLRKAKTEFVFAGQNEYRGRIEVNGICFDLDDREGNVPIILCRRDNGGYQVVTAEQAIILAMLALEIDRVKSINGDISMYRQMMLDLVEDNIYV